MSQLLKGTFLLFIIFFFLDQKTKGQALPKSKHEIVVIAHRGNHVSVPENTLASYREAIRAGVDYVEVDLRTTRDGHLVVLHDLKVDRTTNGHGKISEMSLNEVRKLQVFNQNKKAHRIPEFDEVLQTCKGKVNLYLDFKEADAAQTWKQIEKAGMQHHVVVYLNKKEQYSEWKNVAPNVPLMASVPEDLKNEDGLVLFLKDIKVNILDNVSDPKLVKLAKSHGVMVWKDVQGAQEGPLTWNSALREGATGLQTDKPDALVDYLLKEKVEPGN